MQLKDHMQVPEINAGTTIATHPLNNSSGHFILQNTRSIVW